ncbi:MAG: hypothetical protein LBG22_11755 [Treponema sp.]|jgi:hypothetical protein|nr:hypothetical protein [Treponema sp.]
MERGIYFDAWYKNNHCYHPGLPFRSKRMVEDLEKYRGTLLVWSALGGGSISLPYLEHEAFGEVDPRLRLYGFMNDKEFIAECEKRGIKVFGIVFEVQGWEFPAVIGKDDSGKMVFKRLNLVEEDEEGVGWYGLREFTQDKYWEVFGKKLQDYFPEGLFHSDGAPVKDIWSECCAVTYTGKPVHARWVEVAGHRHEAYQMCRNNPVWRQYLKKIIEIQIDAGVQGVQLDECELPMTSIGEGGCFCRYCMEGFNDYLKGLKRKGELCKALMNEDFQQFHYGEYILKNNLEYPRYYEDVPLYKYYWEYQLHQIKKYFAELVDYAKDYSRKTKNRDILVSGNFFTLMPSYYALEPYTDVIITEMKNTLFRQPAWYRYAAGFAGDKPLIVAENPYGGVIPELLEMLNRGKGYDLYRIFLLEAAMYGCNMSVPYGGWMGNTIRNSFHPPEDVTVEVQNFIADRGYLFSRKSGANVAVLYSFPSYYWREAITGYSNNVVVNAEKDLLSYTNQDMDSPNSSRLPFWEALRVLSDMQIPYDVVLAADGELREDRFSFDVVRDYDVLILPDCMYLTARQFSGVKEFVVAGKALIVWGRMGENLPGMRDELMGVKNVQTCDNPVDKQTAIMNFQNTFLEVYRNLWIIRLNKKELGVHIHHLRDSVLAVHLLNYSYDKARDGVLDIGNIVLEVKRTGVKKVLLHTLSSEMVIEATSVREKEGITAIFINSLPLFAVVELIFA